MQYFWIPVGFILLIILSATGFTLCSEGMNSLNMSRDADHGVFDHSSSAYFSALDFDNKSSDQNLTLIPVPPFQQTSELTCGPASAIMVLRYYGKNGDEDTIAKEMDIIPRYGVDVRHMAGWFEKKGFFVQSSIDGPDGNLTMLRENLRNGIPTLVASADWYGHWMVVTGYDTMGTERVQDDVIIFADPYDVTDHQQDGYYHMSALRFYYLWFVPRWSPEKEGIHPWVTVRM